MFLNNNSTVKKVCLYFGMLITHIFVTLPIFFWLYVCFELLEKIGRNDKFNDYFDYHDTKTISSGGIVVKKEPGEYIVYQKNIKNEECIIRKDLWETDKDFRTLSYNFFRAISRVNSEIMEEERIKKHV